MFVAVVILNTSPRIFEVYSLFFYVFGIVLLLGLFVFGKTIKGQTNWYQFGGMSLQPSELMKLFTILLLSKYLSDAQVNLNKFNHQFFCLLILAIPIGLILLQPDAGSALVFLSLIFLLHRFGLSSWYIYLGFGAIILFALALFFSPLSIISTIFFIMVFSLIRTKKVKKKWTRYVFVFLIISIYTFSVDYIFDKILEPHQQDRIKVLYQDNINLQKEGYNLNQSLIAIGSGGWFGKGYLEGTQTKGGFVPEQHTDYIFTTIGEEWGFVGSTVIILLFMTLILRILYLTNRQKSKFTQIYGYGVACILGFHFLVNIAMLIKLFPTIGVPLPFFSYGGSSMIAFTLLLFIFIRLDANRLNEW
jgi:rod shape determining protein RodA